MQVAILVFLTLVPGSFSNFIPSPFLTQVPFALFQGPACSNLYLSVPANGSNVAVSAVMDLSGGDASLWTLIPVNDATRSLAAVAFRNVKFGTYLSIPVVPDFNNCAPVVRVTSTLNVSAWWTAHVGSEYPAGAFALRSLVNVDPSAFTVASLACGAGSSVTAVPTPSGCEMLQMVFKKR
jgi:hypothetical protein